MFGCDQEVTEHGIHWKCGAVGFQKEMGFVRKSTCMNQGEALLKGCIFAKNIGETNKPRGKQKFD